MSSGEEDEGSGGERDYFLRFLIDAARRQEQSKLRELFGTEAALKKQEEDDAEKEKREQANAKDAAPEKGANDLEFEVSLCQKRLFRMTNEALLIIVPPNRLAKSIPLGKLKRILIEKPPAEDTPTIKIRLELEGVDDEEFEMGSDDIGQLLVEWYKRSPSPPLYLFEDEIQILGPHPNHIDLLLFRLSRENGGRDPLNVRALQRLSSDDDSQWLKIIDRTLQLCAVVLGAKQFLANIIRTVSLPNSPKTAAAIFSKLAEDGMKAFEEKKDEQQELCWLALSHLIAKFEGGPLVTEAVDEKVLRYLVKNVADPQDRSTAMLLEDLILDHELQLPAEVQQEFVEMLKKLIESHEDTVHRFRCKSILWNLRVLPQPKPEEGPAVRVRSDRGAYSLRISNHESDGLWVLNDDSKFHTVVATHNVTAGKWYYEATLLTDGISQLGWCTDKSVPNPDPDVGKGVGDDEHSWAYDGRRQLKWHDGQAPYGIEKPWKAGDVVGCFYDADKKQISFSLNGKSLGLAFENVSNEGGMAPGCSLSRAQGVKLNLGSLPFKHRPDDSWLALASVPPGCVQRAGPKGLSRSMAATDAKGGRMHLVRSGSSIMRESVQLCHICADRPANTVLLPCKHENVCMKCAEHLKTCPFCRTPVTGRQRVAAQAPPNASPAVLAALAQANAEATAPDNAAEELKSLPPAAVARFRQLFGGSLQSNKKEPVDAGLLARNEAVAAVIGCANAREWGGLINRVVDTYTVQRVSGRRFAIVYVSADAENEAYEKVLKQMPATWMATPPTAEVFIRERYGILDAPVLVLLNGQGNVVGQPLLTVASDREGQRFPWIPRQLMDILTPLVNSKGEPVTLESVRAANELLLLYFANTAVKPCSEFLPKLLSLYGKLKSHGKPVEVIFVSSDRDPKEFKAHYAQMPWLALSYADRPAAAELRDLLDVDGIPELAVIDAKAGKVLNREARRDLLEDVEGAKFPWVATEPQPLELLTMRNITTLHKGAYVVALLDAIADEHQLKQAREQLEAVAKEFFTEGEYSHVRFGYCDSTPDGKTAAKRIREYLHVPDMRPQQKPPADRAKEFVCAKGHPLTPTDRACSCDVCKSGNHPRGEWHWHCKEDDYDACPKCLPPPAEPGPHPAMLLLSNLPKKKKHIPADATISPDAARQLAKTYIEGKLPQIPLKPDE